MRITKQNLIAAIATLARYTGKKYTLESGSMYTQWKVCNESGYEILRANTKTELYNLIMAYRNGVYDTRLELLGHDA